ncbi:MAG TPA: ABC transporter permease [Casimicrobiaceae bacterium]|nr:ABC transporter permease [Casimicrobiaceae bacterium]
MTARASWWRGDLSTRRRLAISCFALAVFVGAWWIVTGPLALASPLFLPSPQEVAGTLVRMSVEPYLGSTLWGHIGASLSVVMSGWLLAGLVGLPLGIAMAWWRRLRWIVFPVFQLLRPVPPLAWIPLAIVWLGLGDAARISVVFIAALVPWLMNSMQAVYSVDALLVHAARTLGASERQILVRVVARTALPTLVAGARIALGNAWTTLIAAELLAASSGLGYIALNAARTLETGVLLVAMGIIGLLGALFSVGMRQAARALAPWSVRSGDE